MLKISNNIRSFHKLFKILDNFFSLRDDREQNKFHSSLSKFSTWHNLHTRTSVNQYHKQFVVLKHTHFIFSHSLQFLCDQISTLRVNLLLIWLSSESRTLQVFLYFSLYRYQYQICVTPALCLMDSLTVSTSITTIFWLLWISQ